MILTKAVVSAQVELNLGRRGCLTDVGEHHAGQSKEVRPSLPGEILRGGGVMSSTDTLLEWLDRAIDEAQAELGAEQSDFERLFNERLEGFD
jgi:hypothetical protein